MVNMSCVKIASETLLQRLRILSYSYFDGGPATAKAGSGPLLCTEVVRLAGLAQGT